MTTCWLDKLRLNEDERLALRRNGFVSGEPRGDGILYKLRFRVQGCQRVRSLGTDPVRARAIEQDLIHWQRDRQAALAARRAAEQVRRLLRESKRLLQPFVAATGLQFHGRTIRRPHRKVVDFAVLANGGQHGISKRKLTSNKGVKK